MLFLFFLIFLVLIGVSGYYLVNKYEHTISALKVKLNLMNAEMTKMISNQSSSILNNFSINFLDFDETTALLNENSNLYLFPASVSPVLSSNSKEISVNILVKASALDLIWYFVSSSPSDAINLKGWVTDNSLSFPPIDNTSEEIIN